MPSITLGTVAAGIAGTTGVGSLAVSALAVLRTSPAHVAPGQVWTAIGTGTIAALVASLGLILDFRLRKLRLEAQCKVAEASAELKKIRLDVLKKIMEKASDKPQNAQYYQDLIRAGAMYLSVEQNGMRLTDWSRDVRAASKPVSSVRRITSP